MDKKNLVYRIVSSLMLLSSVALSLYLFIDAFSFNEDNKYLFNMICVMVAAVFVLLQIVIILISIGRDLNLGHIAFNRFKSLNKPALIIVNVFLAIGIAIFVAGLVLYFNPEQVSDTKGICLLIITVGFLLIIETLLYIINYIAPVLKLVDRYDSKSYEETHIGSIPIGSTIKSNIDIEYQFPKISSRNRTFFVLMILF